MNNSGRWSFSSLVLATLGLSLFGVGCEPEETGIPTGRVCMLDKQTMSRFPVDIILVVDRSGSMSGQLWTDTTTALHSFFLDPASFGVRVALNLFPAPTSYNACDPALYNPPQIAPQVLPGGAAQLGGAFDFGTGGGTPMYAALDGTYLYAEAYLDANPDYKIVVVLTSDGAPTSSGCDDVYGTAENWGSIEVIAARAARAFESHRIETYGVIMDPSASSALDAIAAAGGSFEAFDVSADVSQFAQRIGEIRDSVAVEGCEYGIPNSDLPVTIVFEPGLVNIYMQGSGLAPEAVPRVSTPDVCGGQQGWYYDNADAPSVIILCPVTCSFFANDPMLGLVYEYGCETETR